MEISEQIINKINGEEIYSINFTNKNNYSLNFYNFGGYIHKVLIPYKNDTSKAEDVILGYSDLEGCKHSISYFNAVIGRVANRISNAKFVLNRTTDDNNITTLDSTNYYVDFRTNEHMIKKTSKFKSGYFRCFM